MSGLGGGYLASWVSALGGGAQGGVWADPHPHEMAIAAVDTHPTGMHSRFILFSLYFASIILIAFLGDIRH